MPYFFLFQLEIRGVIIVILRAKIGIIVYTNMGALRLTYQSYNDLLYNEQEKTSNLRVVRNHEASSNCCKYYYAFGSLMSGRNFASSDAYRYGFNGMEKDDEMKGNGNSYDFGFRLYDPRLGRFLAVDPLFKEYPHNTPYSYAENDVIRSIDVEGLEKLNMSVTSDPNSTTGEPGKAAIEITKDYIVVTAGTGAVKNHQFIRKKILKNYE